MTTAERPQYRVIGTSPIRPDGVEKVTGKALYGADVRPPGMVHGRVLRSPHAHARIVNIDTSEAEAMEGVLAVVTAADFPEVPDEMTHTGESMANLREAADNILASTKVLYRGHAVAAVAAANPHVAEEALKKIRVEYDVLPAVVDVRSAMTDGAPLLKEDRHTQVMPAGETSEKPSNIVTINLSQVGDPEAAFAEADHIVEREFTTQMVHQGYIEPQNATANWNSDGTLTIWTSTQGMFGVRQQTARMLQMPMSSVRVIPMEIGGGFGGKIAIYLEPVAALLSRKSGKPVQVTMDRTSVFEATGPTGGTYIKIKMAEKGGKLTGADILLAYECGAYPGTTAMFASWAVIAPYKIENYTIEGRNVAVNKPKTQDYRAPGAPAAAFACESVVDELARLSGTDPLQFRLENSSKEGDRQVNGMPFSSIGHEECVQAALASDHYNSPIEGPYRGRGVASGFWINAGLQSSVSVSVNGDGTVNLLEGSTDIGGTRASLAMQLAEALEIPYESVRPVVGDTDTIAHNDTTAGSRTTYAGGVACHQAAMDIRRQAAERAAKAWECSPDDLDYAEGAVFKKDDPEKRMSLQEMAAGQMMGGGPIVGRASVMTGMLGGPVGSAFAVHICDVEVDPDTGKVDILRYTAVQDAGKAIHPAYVEGQMQGGAVQGIGWALNEEYYYNEDGRMENSSFLDYRIPTALDLPDIETIIVEVPNPGHPYGVRGVGEVGIVPPLAAVANAVADATGERFTDLPMSPRRIVERLNDLK